MVTAVTIWRDLSQRRHGRDDVEHLEAALLAAENALLTGDHDNRHGAEQTVGRPCPDM